MMNALNRFFIRLYQRILYLFSFFLQFKEPVIIKGTESFQYIITLLKHYQKKKAFLITDIGLHQIHLDDLLIESLEKENFQYHLYYDITSNPSINQVEEGVKQYHEQNCDCIIVMGGGSAMDAAKIIGARVTNKKTSVEKMRGLFKIRRKLPLLIAIPTTAGTGSETTIAAVITNKKTKEKFAIESLKILPSFAILNPALLVNLPKEVTATTGMDTLTHAIEAFIGSSNTIKTKESAILTVQFVFKYLYSSYENPSDLLAREKMQIASYYGGIAFSRAYVGYAHAIAHTLGGYYDVSHGLANAIILPIVLKEYGASCHYKLAKLYDALYLNSTLSNEEKANQLIAMIEDLNRKMNITNVLKDIVLEKDIPILVERAMKEAIPLYPTPQIWGKQQFEKIYRILLEIE